MDTLKKTPVIVLFIVLISLLAQDKPVYQMLGENVKTVINTYGKPAKHDKSDPLLEMIFYKTSDLSYCFVATDKVVFQTEMTKSYNSESSAKKAFNYYVNDLIQQGMTQTDSTAVKRCFHSSNKLVEVEIMDNNYKKTHELRIKGQKF